MYGIIDYGRMIKDPIRLEAYALALKKILKPGQVVMDIGTGTGIFALLACRFGAGKVYAIEPDQVIHLARETAKDNGLSDRIVFIKEKSTRINLPEKADVVISDLRGILPLFHHHIPAIIDARERCLSSNGKLIPAKDTLWAAVAEAPDLFDKLSKPWNEKIHNLTLARGKNYTLHSWIKGRVKPSQLLTDPKQWTELDYMNIQSPHVKEGLRFRILKDGSGYGFLVWFDSILTRGIGFSNAPAQPELIYSSAFFPWLGPVQLKAGDTVSIDLKADLVDNDYLWQWRTRIFHSNDPETLRHEFQQSSFQSIPITLDELKKKDARYKPRLNLRGKIDRAILNLMDGTSTNREMADRIYETFPEAFPDRKEVLNRVCRLSKLYT